MALLPETAAPSCPARTPTAAAAVWTPTFVVPPPPAVTRPPPITPPRDVVAFQDIKYQELFTLSDTELRGHLHKNLLIFLCFLCVLAFG